MFNKKVCRGCGEKIKKNNRFCPNCGYSANKSAENEDWGLLGKDDFQFSQDEIRLPMGLNMIFNSLMKNLNKELSQLDNEAEREFKNNMKREGNNAKKSGISISISTFGNNPPKIKVHSLGNDFNLKQKEMMVKEKMREIPSVHFSQKELKRFSELPKKEPSANIRRLSNKVVYDIELPGVKSIKDVSIIRLENSIEIKALAKDRVYSKQIPINLPLTNYKFSNGKLVLELEARE